MRDSLDFENNLNLKWSQFGRQSYQVENRYAHTFDQFDWSRSQQATSGFTSFEDEQRNNTAKEDFIQLEGYSKSTEVFTINDPDNVEVEEGGAQSLSNSEDNPYDDPEDEDVVFICETVRSNELISRSTSQEHVELDAPAQPATPRASYNEVSVEYFYCHICHTHLDDAPVS
jgi:hypothetical protein